MSQQPKAIKGKVLLGYLLLFSIAVISVWFIYTEILKIANPAGAESTDNNKIIKISDAIAGLYAAEAVGRNSILTGSEKDFLLYNRMLDSINIGLEEIKKESDETQLGKFDTIQSLLRRKKSSIAEIIIFRKKNNVENTFDKAVSQVYKVKDSLSQKVKPVQFDNGNQMYQFMRNVLPKKQLDSLSKLPVSNDELTAGIEQMLTKLIVRNNKMKYDLFRKEQKLQDENRVLSDRLRVVLSSLEKEILEKSYAKINRSRNALDNTVSTMAWIGAITFLLLVVFAWIIIRDLSINQRYRQQLEVLNSENENLLRSKTMLMATVTHDIQTPLGSVIGFTDLLTETDPNSRQKQYIENIRHSSQYIVKLVNDLVDFSRLENNKITIEKVSFNFRDLIENTCRPLEPNATNKHIELNWDIDDELDDNFISDPYRLRQILTNLISNAIKFTQEGSVQVSAAALDDTIEISVIDTGIGIAKDQQRHVFEEFTQAHAGIEKKFGGTGLGLTIAKRMLQLLGGDIRLESEEGQGSIFTIHIPKIRSEVKAPSFAKEQRESENDFLKGKKILIVDDDAMQLTLMNEIFANYPVEVVTESDSGNVLKLLGERDFDLVMSDIQMPKIDGFELVKQIRDSDDAISQIPVIALSGKRDLSPEDFTGKGFTASHPKPLQLKGLLALMRAIFANEEIPDSQTAKTTTSTQKLFDLETLNQFTQDDPDSLRLIIDTFIESSKENCASLTEAASQKDYVKMTSIAHKMIPMLKQMDVFSIVKLLEPIEDAKLDADTDLVSYTSEICRKMDELFIELRLQVQKN
ncbi:response regulator [Flavobacterium sp. MAH-1]|uniref:histidine kinase n=1 Tax=Flavobacterium agri TaxID=2743471 RepID=A0A7Y9C6U6_9FLAO|nr:ATP-binding protein [Flavobacterium agri]NUY80734.1 response regulator [Flavobacterium agri]NYA70758.1 response regulator [Flavobacterium agri]